MAVMNEVATAAKMIRAVRLSFIEVSCLPQDGIAIHRSSAETRKKG
jgi:hypothetical protein